MLHASFKIWRKYSARVFLRWNRNEGVCEPFGCWLSQSLALFQSINSDARRCILLHTPFLISAKIREGIKPCQEIMRNILPPLPLSLTGRRAKIKAGRLKRRLKWIDSRRSRTPRTNSTLARETTCTTTVPPFLYASLTISSSASHPFYIIGHVICTIYSQKRSYPYRAL